MTTYTDLVTLISDANTSLTAFSGAVNQLVAELSNQSLL